MKTYEAKTHKIVTKRECVELMCDLCGCKADWPDEELFDWCCAGKGRGALDWFYAVGGDCDSNHLDLCYECADALGDVISNPNKRQQLLALIGRERHE